MNDNNVVFHKGHVSRKNRNMLNSHRSGLVWLTGLSGAGKSTIAHKVEEMLFQGGVRCYVLDGDNVRHGINSNLGFSREDRKENLRRVTEVSKIMIDAGILCLAAFISPYREDRENIRGCFEDGEFIEVFVNAPMDLCERRDPKGLYAKAKAGQIKEFTGISAPYEAPEKPEIELRTDRLSVAESVTTILEYLNVLDTSGAVMI